MNFENPIFCSSRNYKFEVNFGNSVICEKDDAERPHFTIKAGGDAKEPWFPAIDEGYTLAAIAENKIGNVPRYTKIIAIITKIYIISTFCELNVYFICYLSQD